MLTPDVKDRFDEQGFLLLPSLFEPERDFADVISTYDRILDDLNAPASDLPLSADRIGERSADLYRMGGSLFAQHFDISLPPRPSIPAATPICLDPAIFSLLSHPRLLDAIEALIGPEIAVNPVCHVRIKPPQLVMDQGIDQDDLAKKLNQNDRNGLVSETPWHQDNAVFTEDVDDVDILTVWFPITSAPIEKGCLKVVPGSHKGGLRAHCPGSTSDLAIPDALMTDEPLALPMAAGDVLFLHRKTCHGSLPNLTRSARFSFDLRFQPLGTPNGREILPSFPLRSRQAPAAVLKDASVWAETWREARERLSKTEALPPMNRWSADSPICA